MRTIVTDIRIDAPVATVWRVLTDLPRHPEWNPFIRDIRGDLRDGGRLTVAIAPPGGKGMTFRPVVLTFAPERELRWRGRLLVPGLFDGEHWFRLEPEGAGTRFHHGEDFSGLLVALMGGGAMWDRTRDGFAAMNAALKRRAEAETATA